MLLPLDALPAEFLLVLGDDFLLLISTKFGGLVFAYDGDKIPDAIA